MKMELSKYFLTQGPFAILLGLTLGVFYIEGDLKESIIVGLMLGLSASGLYSGTKSIAKSITNRCRSFLFEN